MDRDTENSKALHSRLKQLASENCLLNIAVESMSQGLCMFDAKKRLIFANRRYAQIYDIPDALLLPGTPFSRILGLRVETGVYTGSDPDSYIQERLKAVEDDKPTTKLHKLRNGRVIEISHRPMPTGGWVATHEDITDAKRAEASLRESKEMFSTVFQANPVACAIAAPKDGFHYDVNQRWTELLGYSREEALQNTALDLGIWADPADRARFVGLLQQHGACKGYEAPFRRRDGDIIDVRVSGVFADFNGEPRLFNTYEDITERKRAKRLLAHHTAVMSLMKSVAFTANQSTDANDALRRCLEMVCAFMDWQVGHVYGVTYQDAGMLKSTESWFLTDPSVFGPFKEASIRESSVAGEAPLSDRVITLVQPVWTGELLSLFGPDRAGAAERAGLVGGIAVPIKVRDAAVAVLEFYSTNQIVPSESHLDILTEVGTQIGRVMERSRNETDLIAHRDQLEDLVEQRTEEVKRQALELQVALAKEKELNALQRQFVSMASHEFRTPLTIILNAAQRLERRKDAMTPEMLLAKTGKIRSAIERMTRLIDSTLSLARLEKGELSIEPEPCDIEDLFRTVCACHQDFAKTHRITCTTNALPDRIRADKRALEQVLGNLLINAVKYSPDSPEIDVLATGVGDEVVIQVRDRGLGIDEEDVPKVFRPFFRAQTSVGITGTGIGLHLVKSLVELHGGSVAVASEKDKGSVFTLRLPVNGPTSGVPEREKAA